MNKIKKPIILLFILFVMIGTYIFLIFTLFKPYYKVEINNVFVGYYETYEEYNEYVNKIIEQKSENEYEINLYFSSQPIFHKEYAKEKYVKTFNNYNLLKDNINKDYIIYKVIVNNEIKTYTKNQQEAEQFIENIKKEVKENTTFSIEKTTVKSLNELSIEEKNENIKNQIINENKKITITSRSSNTIRKNSSSVATSENFARPVSSSTVTSQFGPRHGKTHTGVDFSVPLNSNVMASKGGTVVFSGWKGSYGYYVKIQHNQNEITAYAHNNTLLVKVGEKVSQGQVIAKSGSTGNSTGPHCHFEIIINGNFQNPLNYL